MASAFQPAIRTCVNVHLGIKDKIATLLLVSCIDSAIYYSLRVKATGNANMKFECIFVTFHAEYGRS